MLDQLDLFDAMAQEGLLPRRSQTWKDGKRVQGRGWKGLEGLDTFFTFLLTLRLKYSEDIFREKIEELGRNVQAPVKLVDFVLNENAADDYRVTVTCSRPDGSSLKIRSKYIVGCDGGSSTVRTMAGIPMVGADKEDHWVRIDGIIHSNMPDSREPFCAIESKSHGMVLWGPLDHGATRIGYVLTPEMLKRYGRNMSKEDAMKEARAAMAPFELEFEEVHWHTVYGIKQHVAARMVDRRRIILAGDAAHTHSSGTAQGMNTGVHDVVNLGWRLAGSVKGWYKSEILDNYSDERRAIAQQLIDNDRIISALIGGQKPDKYKSRSEEVNILIDEVLTEQHAFNHGFGVEYKENILNDVQNSFPPLSRIPGQRAPDVLLYKNGLANFPIRLLETMKFNGKFHVLVFAGVALDTHADLVTLRSQVDRLSGPFSHVISFRTIVAGTGITFREHMKIKRHFGDGYWDIDHRAHDHYKIPVTIGALAVVRPDGMLGFVAPLNGFDKVVEYLSKIAIPKEQKAVVNGANGHTNGHVGELINPQENNLYYKHAKENGMPASFEEGHVAAG